MTSGSFAGKLAAPAFPEDVDWVNTDRPMTIQEFQGKIVILDLDLLLNQLRPYISAVAETGKEIC